MDEQNTGRRQERSCDNNPKDHPNANLVRMLKKAQEKQLKNLITKLTKTMSSSLTKMVASIFEITKGTGKRMQEDQAGQGSCKKAKTYVKRPKEDKPTWSK